MKIEESTQLGVLCLFQDGSGLLPEVICPTLNVLGATYANCDGRYKVTGERVDWSPDRPVYKHVNKDRYIFWNAGGLGWSIGKKAYLKTGSHWHRSKFNASTIPYNIPQRKVYRSNTENLAKQT